MLVLASDTTGKSLSIALVKDGCLIGESRFHLGYNHAVTHLPQMTTLLKACNMSLEVVDLLAVTSGPGSFTGTRIGLSSFKAMAYALQKPLLGISTLETLAWPWRHHRPALVCPLLDARNGRVFAACYQTAKLTSVPAGISGSCLIQPGNYHISEFLEQLARQAEQAGCRQVPVLIVGDGAPVAMAWQDSHPPEKALEWIRVDAIHDAPSASVVALLAEAYYREGADGNPFHLNATYLTPSAAERLQKAASQP